MMLCLWLLVGGLAHALELPDLLDDPLQTVPPIINSGVRLPDQAPVICSDPVDLIQPLGLSEVIDLALCHNPQLRIVWADIKIQAGVLGQQRAAYLPTINATLSGLHSGVSYPGLSASDTQTTGHTAYANISWRLLDFGGRAASLDYGQALLDAALASHDAALQNLLAVVIKAYFDLQTAQATYQSRMETALLAQRTLAATQHREQVGSASRNDGLQATTALAKARLAEQRAQGDYHKAVSVLRYQLGLNADSRLLVKDAADQHFDPQHQLFGELQDWLVLAQQRHPAIQAARLQWEAAKARIIASRSEGMPTLDFTASFYQNGYPNQSLQHTRSDTTTVGLLLSVPLFEGFARTYKIREAQAQAEKNRAQWQDIEQQIAGEIVKAHADTLSAYENLSFAESLQASADQALISSQRRYQQGAADILELLAAQLALADARQEQIRCWADWHSARLILLARAGLLNKQPIE